MKLLRKERRENWRKLWKEESFEGETRNERRKNWYESWSKFKLS